MPSLYERGDKFYANWSKDGKRTRFSLRTSNETKARRKLSELEEAYGHGDFDPFADGPKSDPFGYDAANTSLTVSEAIEEFVAEKQRQGRADRTVDLYRSVWRRLTSDMNPDTEVAEMKIDDLHAFIHDSTATPSTQHNRFRHIRAVLNWADCSDLLERIDEPRKPDKLPTPVREEDLSAVIGAVKEDYREKRRRNCCRPGEMIWTIPLFRFAFFTGLRASEIGQLKWKHLDRERGLIRVTEQKNGREQTIPLISKAEEVLEDTPKPRGSECYVFRSPRSPLRDRNEKSFGEKCSRRFCEAREDAEIGEKTFHDLRAGFATALADAGMSAHQIKEAMRHADISTSLKYVRVSRQKLRSEMEDAF
jgi:integrase